MNQNEQNDLIRFLVMPYDILAIKELNMTDKFVFARIAGFRRFYESAKSTADFLGLSKLQVERAKRKLVKLGYIIELKDTGRGKIYQCLDFYSILDKMDDENEGRCDFEVTSDCTQKSYLTAPKSNTENKERIYSSNIGESPVEKSSYGRQDLNELEDLWLAETGINIKSQMNQRRQLSNLVKKYGLDATKTLVKRVGVAVNSSDRFAPQIAVPSDLVGKYGKLPKLVMWEKRKQMSKSFGQVDAPPMAIANLKKGMSDYNEAWDVKSDEERAKVSEMMRQARNKFKF